MSLNAKQVERYQFANARELRDWLNGWTDRQLDVIDVQNDDSEILTVELLENDLEDGSYTYDLRFR